MSQVNKSAFPALLTRKANCAVTLTVLLPVNVSDAAREDFADSWDATVVDPMPARLEISFVVTAEVLFCMARISASFASMDVVFPLIEEALAVMKPA